MPQSRLALAFLLSACAATLSAQPRNFLQRIYGVQPDQPMLAAGAPPFAVNIAAKELVASPGSAAGEFSLTVPEIPLRLTLRHERQQGIDLYRLRHAPNSDLRAEHIRFTWTFPEQFNESMTFDTGALQGQPLFLPDGKVPDNHFTNWGSLFYNRSANLAVGVALDGAEGSRHARRGYSRFTKTATLQLMATTGNPAMELVMFAYRPKSERFWWAEWYQLRSRSAPDIPSNFFPILSPRDLSWQAGERQTLDVIPSPQDAGKKMDLVLIDELRQTIAARVPFEYQLPVTSVPVTVGDWPTSLYRAIVTPAGAAVDPAKLDLNARLTNVLVRPTKPRGDVLFVAPTDMWWAYSTNGSHDYHGWRTGYDGSVGYSPTVMSSRQRRLNNFYYGLYERYTDIHHFRYLDGLARKGEFTVDYATQYDVARGRVRLDNYKLVLIGNHSEFTTRESHLRFQEYLGRGGAVIIHGGDSFAVIVEYLPSLEQPRYLWQRGHVWAHLSDQPSDFSAPQLLPPDAPPNAPILQPSPGSAADYLNVFHSTVGYWISGAKAVVANTAHPITKGMNLTLGQEVPGPWGGEVDFAYQPQAWEVLVRSDRAEPENREFGIDAYDPTPLHRIGMAAHRNLRLAMVCGENFPNILNNPGSTLYRELYRRTLRHYLDTAQPLTDGDNLVPPAQRSQTFITLNQPARIGTLRYQIPAFVDYTAPDWHKKPAPYARYRIEGSTDGQTWTTIVDRRYGPWRGLQTDHVAPATVRHLRFDGTFSNGEPFAVSDVRVFAAK